MSAILGLVQFFEIFSVQDVFSSAEEEYKYLMQESFPISKVPKFVGRKIFFLAESVQDTVAVTQNYCGPAARHVTTGCLPALFDILVWLYC